MGTERAGNSVRPLGEAAPKSGFAHGAVGAGVAGGDFEKLLAGVPPPTLEENEGRLFPPEQFAFTRGGTALAILFFQKGEKF